MTSEEYSEEGESRLELPQFYPRSDQTNYQTKLGLTLFSAPAKPVVQQSLHKRPLNHQAGTISNITLNKPKKRICLDSLQIKKPQFDFVTFEGPSYQSQKKFLLFED